jgi:hypothetical protein
MSGSRMPRGCVTRDARVQMSHTLWRAKFFTLNFVRECRIHPQSATA